jgi:hypothetical protein
MYFENLPEQCPPAHAIDDALGKAWRLVNENPPSQEDFQSHAAAGRVKPRTCDACSWASCSLFHTEAAAREALKLPTLRGRRPIMVDIPERSGRWVKSKSQHVDFWRYANFDILASVRLAG